MKYKIYLIKATNDKEAVMRLPVGKYDALTKKAFTMIRDRFYEGSTETYPTLKYSLCLEQYSTGKDIVSAIERYYKNKINK